MEDMFCFQCQEAAKGTGCTVVGVCGKDADTANLLDLLAYSAKGVAVLSNELMKKGELCTNAANYITEALFTTITNANFDKSAIIIKIKEGFEFRTKLRAKGYELGANVSMFEHDVVKWEPGTDEQILEKAKTIGILTEENEDIRSLKELVRYGVTGIAAYVSHAEVLDYVDQELNAFMAKALCELLRTDITVEELIALTLETGKYGVSAMAILDKANTETYGHPEITEVDLGVRKNPAILISGHDLKDIELLLEQTKDTGVDVYTHSEMLAAQYYPAFKKYDHFAGNYGNAWWEQDKEFTSFNGPILMTTNCLTKPKDNYIGRIYSTGAVGYEGVKHITEDENGYKDFSEIIAQAKTCPAPTEIESGKIVGGFAHHQVGQLAEKVVDAVKSGDIQQFYVMAGCDGRHKSRNYYTEFANELAKDTVILTAGCAKYRYNKLELGDIGGIPRVLDAGQCNDSYSLVLTALKLKEAFGLDSINDLPIVYNIAWYEQKAVIVLLALLHLGVKDIHLGPTLPAFLSPNVVNVLVENFGISGIGTVENDIKKFSSNLVEA